MTACPPLTSFARPASRHPARPLRWLAWLPLLLISACASLDRSSGPPPPELPAAQRDRLVAATADELATQQAMASGSEESRQLARNAYVANRLVLMDVAFIDYLRAFSTDRRTLDAATEGSVLAFSVLGTLRDSVRAKENLAAAVAAITGLKSNVDKNFYGNRGLEAIGATMVARRKEVLTRIVSGLAESTVAYPLVSARADLNDYYLAGTMDGAFLAIQADAQKRDDKASKELTEARAVVRVTELLGADVRKTKRSLTTALGGPKASAENLRKALQALGIADTQPPRSAEEAGRLLQLIVFNAQTPAKVNDLADTFKEAGLLP